MKRVVLTAVFALTLLVVSSCAEDTQVKENDELAIKIKKMDSEATGKEGGSSTGDKDGNQ